MKKLIALLLSFILLITAVPAFAEGDGGETPEPAPAPTATVAEVEDSGYDFAYSFTADESAEDAALSDYKDYFADFTVSFDGGLSAGAVKLAVSYDGYNEGAWDEFEISDVQAGEEISLLSRVMETAEREEKFTYAETAQSLSPFRVAATGVDAFFTTATVKFNLYNPEDEDAGAITCAETEFTFPGDSTAPSATVNTVSDSALVTAYSFTPEQTAEQASKSIYKDYRADFEITFDRDIAPGEIKLAYAYPDNNGGKFVIFDSPEINAGEKYSILDKLIADRAMPGEFTYSSFVDVIKSLSIGASKIDVPYDVNMSIEFNVYDKGATAPITVARQSYTFVDDGITEITLDVKNGEDIADTFTRTARVAKDNPDKRIYKITIPKGSYTASSQLKLWSNTYIYMNGVTIKHTTSDSVMLRFGNKSDLDSSPVTGYNGFQNIHIIGGTFDGGGLDQAIIKIGHSKNISFENITFKNVKNSHFLEAGACSDLTVEKCSFSGFSGSWGSTQNYEAVQFDVTDPKGEHFDGYEKNDDETACNNITVKGCTFKNLQKGMGVHTGVANLYCNNMIFENNTFENITGYAIIGTNFTNSRINGNTIKNCGSGIIFNTMVTGYKNFYTSKKHSNAHSTYVKMNVQINNNNITVTNGYQVVYNNVPYGIRLNGENVTKAQGNTPKGDFRCAGVTVSGNTVNLNTTGYGIWLVGTAENAVKNNIINCNLAKKGKGGNGDGIRLQESSKNAVASNTITNNTTSGYDKELSGITVSENSVSNTFTSNKINKAKKDGFHIDSSKSNKFISNTVTAAGRDGFHSDNSASLTFTSNVIKKAKRNGISVQKGKSSKYEKNTITSCKQNGIHLEKSDSNTCNKNKITSAGKNGIALYNCKKTTLTSNTITSSKQYGMYSSLAKKKAIKKDKGNKIKKSKKRARSWK